MKSKVAFFFIIVFSSIIITPTLVSLIDKKQDVSVFLDINEEEEESTKESFKEIKLYPNTSLSVFFNKDQKKKNMIFIAKNYISKHQKITTPPPKLVT